MIQALQAQRNASVCVISAFHVVEHIAFNVLQTLVREALRALVPGGLLILETPNPENLVVGTSNFYLDPTHIRPIPPLLLEFLPDHYGYIRHKTMRLQEAISLRENDDLRLIEILSGVSPDYAVVAQKAAPPEILQAFDAAFSQDYGLTLGNLSERYENTQRQRQEALNTQIEAMQAQERILSGQVIPQLQQSQLDKLVLQKELLERERIFTAQLTEFHDHCQQEHATLRQSYDVSKGELKRELIALRQAMDTLLDNTQLREQALQQSLLDRERAFSTQINEMQLQHQHERTALRHSYDAKEDDMKRELIELRHAMDSLRDATHLREQTLLESLLDRERAFTAQLGEINVRQLQVQDAVNQTHATHEADLKRQYNDSSETMLSQVRADAAAQVQIYKQLVDRLYEQESALRNEVAQHATYAQAQAERITAIRSTWWWRLSMLFRSVSHWMGDPVSLHSHHDQVNSAHIADLTTNQTQRSESSDAISEFFEVNKELQPMPIQHVYELFSLDGRAFITEAYRNLLGREPDPHGMAYYLGRLAMGYGKASVIADLAQSAESRPHREIIGLNKLIVNERRANHWLWGRFSGRQRQKNLLREGVIQGLARIATIMESLTERMEDHRTFAISNQSHAATKEQYLLSPDDVRAAYREILGREPENDQVIAHHAKCKSADALRQSLLESEEFQYRINMKHLVPANVSQVGGVEGGEVETLDPLAREIYLELESRLLNNPKRSLGEV